MSISCDKELLIKLIIDRIADAAVNAAVKGGSRETILAAADNVTDALVSSLRKLDREITYQ